MADILKILLIVLGILTIYVSYWLLTEALFPKMVQRTSQHYGRPVRITLIGLVAAAPAVLVGLVLANLPHPLAKLLGVTLLVVPAILGLAGSAGLTLRIGAGLPSPADAAQPWHRVLRGGILLACSFLLPLVGWFIVPIWTLVSGFGSFLLSMQDFQRERRASAPPSLVSPTPVAG